MYASAASIPVSENEIMPLSVVAQSATIGDATVTFNFDYSDGNSARLVAVFISKTSNYELTDPPSSYFAGDKCYASVVVKHKVTGELVTLKAWCDIYGDTAQY